LRCTWRGLGFGTFGVNVTFFGFDICMFAAQVSERCTSGSCAPR
jgi:hypothetical protein